MEGVAVQQAKSCQHEGEGGHLPKHPAGKEVVLMDSDSAE